MNISLRPIAASAALVCCLAFTVGPVPAKSGTADPVNQNIVLRSAVSVDVANHTVTLPLHQGVAHGETVWYIVTDASDESVARKLGVLFAPSLANIGTSASQHVSVRGSDYVFEGAPDFSQTRVYTASKTGFPPSSATPGGVADSAYSPFIHVDGTSGILNAPIVATGNAPFDVLRHTNTEDRVVAIDTAAKTVTLVLARGFANGKPVTYLSTEASDPVAAAVERATYVPKLKQASAASAIPIGVVVNGPMSANDGQGLAFLALRAPLSGEATSGNAASIGSPFNVLSIAPDPADVYKPDGYSPLWSVMVLPHSETRITDYSAFTALGPKPAGFVVNCPVVAYE